MQDVNHLKLVLVEQKNTSKWLSEKLGVSPSIISSGIVGIAHSGKPREVLIMDEINLENLLNALR